MCGIQDKRIQRRLLSEPNLTLDKAIDLAQTMETAEKEIEEGTIQKAPSPQNTTQLRSFLGMITYYSKFLPNLSTQLAPIYSLLQKNTRWKWGPKQQKAFEEAKELLVSAKVLAHYDPNKDLYLACDASPYGIGAVLSHRMDNGDERPIAFASRSLSQAERKYAKRAWLSFLESRGSTSTC